MRRLEDAGAAGAFGAPGRVVFECSVLLSALALLFPVAALPAGGLAVWAGRRGAGRWLAALAAALWCGLLGGLLRAGLALPVAP